MTHRKLLGFLSPARQSAQGLQSQLALNLRQAIRSGALGPADRLPSSRELAESLRLGRNTVTAAYDQLVSEGYLESRPRSGLFVAALPAGAQPVAAPAPLNGPRIPRLTGPAPFRPSQPDVRLFPAALWTRLRSRALRTQGTALLHYHSDLALGLPALRRMLAGYLADSRGVRGSWEDVAVTSGSQQGLFILASLLYERDCRTAYLEDPGYPGARAAFRFAGMKIVPLPVDRDGLIPPAALEPGSLVYTTPSRQFPTGATLPAARRIALLQTARAAEAWIVEDDYDSEFRYTQAPIQSLHSLDSAGRVIYLGTVSKVLAPALRIGYVVMPPHLLKGFASLRTTMDDHGPFVDQAALALFISEGHFHRHIRRCRREYGRRMDAFLDAARRLPLTFHHVDGGMNLAGLGELSVPAGFDIPSLADFSMAVKSEGRVFGFSAFTPEEIRAAIRRLQPR